MAKRTSRGFACGRTRAETGKHPRTSPPARLGIAGFLLTALTAAASGLPTTAAAQAPECSPSNPNGDADFDVTQKDAEPEVDYPNDGGKPEFTYDIGGTQGQPMDLEIWITKDDGSGQVVKAYCPDNVDPGSPQEIEWDSTTSSGDKAPKGKYKFQVRERGGSKPDGSGAAPNHRFQWRGHFFPMHGTPHSYGDGFGAGRNHKGVDIFESGFPSPCGAPILAARSGTVQWRAYQGGGAGYYLVIDGAGNSKDYVYMHIKKSSWSAAPKKGDSVDVGEKIGEVGQSGNASACHLHFELWKGDWFNGGFPRSDVKPTVKKWDTWS